MAGCHHLKFALLPGYDVLFSRLNLPSGCLPVLVLLRKRQNAFSNKVGQKGVCEFNEINAAMNMILKQKAAQ